MLWNNPGQVHPAGERSSSLSLKMRRCDWKLLQTFICIYFNQFSVILFLLIGSSACDSIWFQTLPDHTFFLCPFLLGDCFIKERVYVIEDKLLSSSIGWHSNAVWVFLLLSWRSKHHTSIYSMVRSIYSISSFHLASPFDSHCKKDEMWSHIRHPIIVHDGGNYTHNCCYQ